MRHEYLDVEVVPLEHGRYSVQMGIYTAEFREVRRVSQELHALLTLSGVTGTIWWGRLILSSLSQRKEIVREFRRRTRDNYDIERALEFACQSITDHSNNHIVYADYRYDASRRPSVQYLIDPFLPSRMLSVVAGDGGSGKGYLSLALGLLVTTGTTHLTLSPRYPCPVLYVDYESTQEDFDYRVDCLVRGLELDPEQVRIRYLQADLPLVQMGRALASQIQETQAGLIIVDSLAPAIGNLADGADSAIATMRMLRSLGVTVWAIAHIPKHNEGRTPQPYGSVFVKNLARNVWIQSAVSRADDYLTVAVQHTKSNIGVLQSTRFYTFEFGGDTVRLLPVSLDERRQMSGYLSLSERILLALTEPMTAKELADQLGESPSRILVQLSALQKAGRVAVMRGSGKRNDPRVYALVDDAGVYHAPDPPKPNDPFS